MIRVEVPEHNTFAEFPDGTPSGEIQSALRKAFPPKQEEPSALSQYLPSVDKFLKTWQEEAQGSVEQMKKAYQEPSAGNVLRGVLAPLRYAWTPMTAAGKLVSDPLERGLNLAGAPPVVTEVAGKTAEGLVGIMPYGKMVKTAIEAAQAPGMVAKTAATARVPLAKQGKPPLEYPSEPSAALKTEMEAAEQLNKPVIQEGIQAEVAAAAPEALKGTFTENKRIGQQIVDAIHDGTFDMQKLPETLLKYEISPEEFALRLKDTYSTSGRTLSRLSLTVKRLRDTFAENPEAMGILDNLRKRLPEPTGFDRFMEGFSKVETFRRGMLVTQTATTARNIASQTGRLVIGMLDDAIAGTIRGTIGGQGNTIKQIGEGLDTATAVLNRFKPESRARLAAILDADGAELAKMRLYQAPVHEVTLGNKVADVLNTLNRTQEYFFRNIAFEAKMTSLLKRKGLDYKNVDINRIPRQFYDEATDYALEMTFSAMPKGKWAQKFIRDFAGNPFATALVNPFPRFAFGNALPFIKEFSPAGFLTAFRPSVVAELASGNPDKFAKAASRAIEGSVFLGLATQNRMQEEAAQTGSKWYEMKVGDHYVDTRAYGPYNAYLLAGQLIANPDKITAADISQVAIGLNRIAGTGLALTDLLRSVKMETAGQTIGRIGTEYLGSFTVPFRTAKDVVSAFNPEEGKVRDVRGTPIVGKAMANIPYLSQQLPESPSPIKEQTTTTEHPLIRQLTGVSAKTKNSIEKEIDLLGLETSRIFPKTGVPEADRELSRIMGERMSKYVGNIIDSPGYQKLTPTVRKLLMSKIFSEQKKTAMDVLKLENPALAAQAKYHGLGEDVKALLKERPAQWIGGD